MKVSIVVISKNEERNIKECLNSIVNQNYPKQDYEIIVVDSSSDNTPQIVSSFTDVCLIKDGTEGFAHARNKGLTAARCDYVAYIDADCIAPPNWLNVLVKSINGFSGIGGSALPPDSSTYIGRCIACLGYPAGGAMGLDENSDISTCNALFKKRALLSVGGFNESLKFGGEDTDLSRRLRSNGFKIKITMHSFVYHKTRKFSEFVAWSFRRGLARYKLSRNALHFFYPLAVFAYPFTKRYKKLVKKRKLVRLGAISIIVILPALFFFKTAFFIGRMAKWSS